MAESVRQYPGLDISWPGATPQSDRDNDPTAGLVLATLDECSPLAVEDTPGGLRVFFSTPADRDTAAARLAVTHPSCDVRAVDVPDQQWAARSQASLTSVTVGELTVSPPWDIPGDRRGVIIIEPSMGFGTGHHASTRLCLTLLQQAACRGARVLDAGTGSGVLALAARHLGAASVLAIDFDADAVSAARACAALNDAHDIEIRQVDLDRSAASLGEPFSLVLANLTGGLLMRLAPRLAGLLCPGGTLIVSGVTLEEDHPVQRAFADTGLITATRLVEDGWVGLGLRPRREIR